MIEIPPFPKCQSTYAYEDGNFLTCPDCLHEWSPNSESPQQEDKVKRDSNGTELQDGDTVTVIKDLKIKGTSSVVKLGTKVKNIRLVDGDHEISCKIPGIGQMGLKIQFVRKVNE